MLFYSATAAPAGAHRPPVEMGGEGPRGLPDVDRGGAGMERLLRDAGPGILEPERSGRPVSGHLPDPERPVEGSYLSYLIAKLATTPPWNVVIGSQLGPDRDGDDPGHGPESQAMLALVPDGDHRMPGASAGRATCRGGGYRAYSELFHKEIFSLHVTFQDV